MQPTETRAVIQGLATATPQHAVSQADLAEWFCDYFAYPPQIARFVRRLHERSRIETRRSVLPDFSKGAERWLFDPVKPCGIEDRMAVFRTEAPVLGARACRAALAEAETRPEDVTHLIVVTSTGFMTPGPDIAIAEALGLDGSVERAVVAMHGCVGGVVGLALAGQIARGVPAACVLLVCVELCTIHFEGGADRQTMVANSLFSDGAAAAVVTRDEPGRRSLVGLGVRRTALLPDSKDVLGWNLTPEGFELRLSRELPGILESVVKGFVGHFGDTDRCVEMASTHRKVSAWAVHPGGSAILRAVRRSLDLSETDLRASYQTLSDHGNLSSAAVLYALDRQVRLQDCARGYTRGLLLGFGPGLCIDGIEYSLGG